MRHTRQTTSHSMVLRESESEREGEGEAFTRLSASSESESGSGSDESASRRVARSPPPESYEARVARALRDAVETDPRKSGDIPSTKGAL